MISKIVCVVPACLFLFATDGLAEDVVDLAANLIGRPYVWGAEGPDAFDCSGLTQYVYQAFGVELPRRAIDQSRFGDATRRLRRGDLLFFSTDTRQSLVTHVGLYEGGGTMIDASKRHGRVRRDSMTDPYWADRFMFARRVGSGASSGAPGEARDRGRGPMPGGTRETAWRVVARVAGALLEVGRR
jgi:NlpC/P60 family protein